MGHETKIILLADRAYPSQYASDFSAEIMVEAAVDTVAPVAPSSFALTAIAEGIQLTWTNPTLNFDGTPCYDLAWIAVYRSTSSGIDVDNSGTYDKKTLVDGEAYTFPATDTTQSYYFRITAIDRSGNESEPSAELNDTSNKPIGSTPVIPDDATGLIFNDAIGGDGVVGGYGILGIAFQVPPATVQGLRSIRLWYQYTDDGGTTWYDEDDVQDQWTELFPDGFIGYMHKGLDVTGTNAYRYKATFIGEDDSTESSTADTAGGAATTADAANNNDLVAINFFAMNIVALGEVRAANIVVDNLAAVNADLGAVTAGSIVVGSTNKIWLNEGADGILAIGGATKASAPFQVSAAGILSAAGAVISGTSTWTGNAIATTYTAAKCTDALADQTSANVAASISGQGALATLSAVGTSQIDTTVILGGKIVTGLLTASNIQTGTLSASLVNVTNINASNINTGTLSACTISATAITTGTLNFTGGISRSNLSVAYGEISANAVRTAQIYIDGNLQFKPGAAWNAIMGCDGIYYDSGLATANGFITLTATQATIHGGTTSGNDLNLAAADDVIITAPGDVLIPEMPTADPHVNKALWSDSGTVKISSG